MIFLINNFVFMEGKNHTVNKEIKCLEQHEDEEIISNEKKNSMWQKQRHRKELSAFICYEGWSSLFLVKTDGLSEHSSIPSPNTSGRVNYSMAKTSSFWQWDAGRCCLLLLDLSFEEGGWKQKCETNFWFPLFDCGLNNLFLQCKHTAESNLVSSTNK